MKSKEENISREVSFRDEGDQNEHLKIWNIKVHGKTYWLTETSLFCFGLRNPLRKVCIWITLNPWFERLVLLLVLVNTIFLGMTDYSKINYSTGLVTADGSWRNFLAINTDALFTYAFAVEATIKIIALGFFFGDNTYIKSNWNKLDFLVTITSLIGIIPGGPDYSFFRALRVLRPLRSITALPGLRMLVSTILKAISPLMSVCMLLLFLFALFGIFGVQLFSGSLHARCRVTPYPVTRDYVPGQGMNYSDYQCLQGFVNPDDPSDEYALFNTNSKLTYSLQDSPWYIPRDCYWPYDEEDAAVCTFSAGNYHCLNNVADTDESEWRWCGSNYDAYGNKRFTAGYWNGVDIFLNQFQTAKSAEYNEDRDFGITGFDNILQALLTIFTSVTLEGWSNVMYRLMNSEYTFLGPFFFISLVLFGSFFAINLLLAVLAGAFDEVRQQETSQKEEEKLHFHYDMETVSNVLKFKGPFYNKLGKIVKGKAFSGTITFLIIINTIVLACDRYPLANSTAAGYDIVSFLLSLIFLIEMLMKLLTFGISGYCCNAMNVFDGSIVIISIIEILITPPPFMYQDPSESTTSGGLSILRSFRLFRIFKLAREWKSMRELMQTIFETIKDMGNFTLLLILFMFIYSLVGMEILANQLHFDSSGYKIPIEDPQWSEYGVDIGRCGFDNLLHAFTTVFQILTGDNWNECMYDGFRGIGKSAYPFYFTLAIFGQFIIMNVFLAILLSNFSTTSYEEEVEKNSEPTIKKIQRFLLMIFNKCSSICCQRSIKVAPIVVNDDSDDPQFPVSSVQNGEIEMSNLLESNDMKNPIHSESGGGHAIDAPHAVEGTKLKIHSAKHENDEGEVSFEYEVIEQNGVFPLNPKKTLCIFDDRNPIRIYVAKLISDARFERIIFCLITFSSLMLVLDNPLNNPDTTKANVLKSIDLVMTIIFITEMGLKILAVGFIFQKGSYLRDSWNILDFFVVGVSIISLFGNSSLSALKSLRSLRALRPLRVIQRAPELKLIVNSLLSAIPDVMNVSAVVAVFYLIFGILFINFYKGMLRECQGDMYESKILSNQTLNDFLVSPPDSWDQLTNEQRLWFGFNSDIPEVAFTNDECFNYPANGPCCKSGEAIDLWSSKITSKMVCECWGAEWDLSVGFTFDNIVQAFSTMFLMSTLEGWSGIMYAAIDATAIDYQPIRDHRPYRAFLFMIFMVVGSYLLMNLFIGVIIDNFNNMKDKAEGGISLLTPAQQAWIKTQQLAMRISPKRRITSPDNNFGIFCYKICMNPSFDVVSNTFIFMNTVLLMINFYGQPDSLSILIDIFNYLCAFYFTVECVIKLCGLRVYFWYENWNIFDLIVVILTNLGVLLTLFTDIQAGGVATVIRTIRVFRLFRLSKSAKTLNKLFNTLLLTLPGMGNIGLLLLLLYFIYAVMGVQLFAKIELQGEVDENANFQKFGTAMLLLFRLSTGESWGDYMVSIAAKPDGCDNGGPDYDSSICGFEGVTEPCNPINGCGSNLAYPFFISFQLIIAFIFLNLFIGVILQGFETAEEGKTISQEDLDMLQDIWVEYDPMATQLIPYEKLNDLLHSIPMPLGLKGRSITEKELIHFINKLNLTIYEDSKIHFTDVALGLSREEMKRKQFGDDFMKVPDVIAEKLSANKKGIIRGRSQRRFGSTDLDALEDFEITTAHYSAAIIIQKCVRRKLRILRKARMRKSEEIK